MQAKLCPLGILFKPSEAGLLLLRVEKRTLYLSTPPRAEMGDKGQERKRLQKVPREQADALGAHFYQGASPGVFCHILNS